MKTLIIAAISMLSLSAFADFNGVWHGEGTMMDNSGMEYSCTNMTITMVQTATSMAVTTGQFTCDGVVLKITPVSYQVSGLDLIQNGQKVGTISPDEWDNVYAPTTADDNFDVKLYTDGTIRLDDMLIGEGGYVFVTGQLSK